VDGIRSGSHGNGGHDHAQLALALYGVGIGLNMAIASRITLAGCLCVYLENFIPMVRIHNPDLDTLHMPKKTHTLSIIESGTKIQSQYFNQQKNHNTKINHYIA